MLRVDEICSSYGEIQVLNGISLSVGKGKIVSLIGGNGSGKSTLINTISGLIRPKSGHVFFSDSEISFLPANEIVRRGVVQVPEGRKLFPQMTVYENLLVGGSSNKREDREKELEIVYGNFPILKERARQIAGTLSGGEQQMLAIGRGLMSKPQLFMLDEPSLGLAPLVVVGIFKTIKSLNAVGLTVFLVEQNIRQSLRLCSYGYVIQNGQIILEGSNNELLANELTKKAYLGM